MVQVQCSSIGEALPPPATPKHAQPPIHSPPLHPPPPTPPPPTRQVGKLARKSYALHQELAQQFGADSIGYRTVDTLSISAAAAGPTSKPPPRKRLAAPLPGWLDGGGIVASSSIGTPETTAQVHPQKLTRALWTAAEAAGARLVRGAVQGLAIDAHSNRVTGVELEGAGVLPADAVLIALGPWSGQATAWLPQLPAVGGQKAHSVVLRPKEAAVLQQAVFSSYKDAEGKVREPEVYPRPDGSVYVSDRVGLDLLVGWVRWVGLI